MSIRQFETAQVKAQFLGKPHYTISGLDQLGLNLQVSEFLLSLEAGHKELSGVPGITKSLKIYVENNVNILRPYFIKKLTSLGLIGLDKIEKTSTFLKLSLRTPNTFNSRMSIFL